MAIASNRIRRARPLLGTFVEIEVAGTVESAVNQAIDAAFDAIASVHRLMSFHDPDSDVSRLNSGSLCAAGQCSHLDLPSPGSGRRDASLVKWRF